MLSRALWIAVGVALLFGAPAARASTLSFGASAYTFAGGRGADELTVSYEAGPVAPAVVFDDATGSITVTGLPADCTTPSAGQVRCATIPTLVRFSGSGGADTLSAASGADGTAWPSTIPLDMDGGRGDDTLHAGAAGDFLVGSYGADTLQPGLGADEVNGNCEPARDDCDSDVDVLDSSQDGRKAGIRIVTDQFIQNVTGPDKGDEANGVSAFRLTDLDDTFAGRGEVFGLAGDDFISTKIEEEFGEDDQIKTGDDDSNSTAIDCGPGDDLYAADISELDVDCDNTGLRRDVPTAGRLGVSTQLENPFARATLKGRKPRLTVKGGTYCGEAGDPCRFTMASKGVGSKSYVLEPGEFHDLSFRVSKAVAARVLDEGTKHPIDIELSKPGTWVNGKRFKTLSTPLESLLR